MAVYDGHGGTGVANYLKDHLHEFILAQPEYRCEIMPPGPLVRHHLQQRFHITTDTELWRVINGPTKNNDRQRQTPLRDLWPPRHLIRVMRRHDFNIKRNWQRQEHLHNHDKDMVKMANLHEIVDSWEPEFMTIIVTCQLYVTLDSIRNPCDVRSVKWKN